MLGMYTAHVGLVARQALLSMPTSCVECDNVRDLLAPLQIMTISALWEDQQILCPISWAVNVICLYYCGDLPNLG